MDSFENLVATILQHDGWWTRDSVKIPLTPEDKVRAGIPSSAPRAEIDVVAYKPGRNLMLLVECKSYLDSAGVKAEFFDPPGHRHAGKYKLFTAPTATAVIQEKLVNDFVGAGTCASKPSVQLALATAHIASEKDRVELTRIFDKKGWRLLEET